VISTVQGPVGFDPGKDGLQIQRRFSPFPNHRRCHSGHGAQRDEIECTHALCLEESVQLAREAGYQVREEPLGELPGGACVIGGRRSILVNLESPAADRLNLLLAVLAADADAVSRPMSRLLAARLRATVNRETN
jgi:hypothetical protein